MNRQFPPEIIQLIVEASLDPYDFFDPLNYYFHTRSAILRSYSLLNSSWYGASQRELVKSVEFHTSGSVVNFLEMTQRRDGTVEGVRDLWVAGIGHDDSSALPKLFKATPHLINLHCHLGTMNVGDLAQLQRLRKLELERIVVIGSPSSSLLCLPDLQRLSMTAVLLEDSASHFLTPDFLPQLRRIDTNDFDSIAPLIPQLEIITFAPYYSYYVDYTLLSRAKSLLLLPLSPYPGDRQKMLYHLPSLPPFLHINFASVRNIDVGHEVAFAFEELLEVKKPGLRIILVNDHGFDESVKSPIQRLLERGIRVQLVDKDLDFDGAIVEMDKIRAGEKRAAEKALIDGK